MTLDEMHKYIERSKLPAAKDRYEMMCSTMFELINYVDSEEKKIGHFDTLFTALGYAFEYGRAAGYRMGKRW